MRGARRRSNPEDRRAAALDRFASLAMTEARKERQHEKADRGGEHEDRGDRRGEDRTSNEEADHQRGFTQAPLAAKRGRAISVVNAPRSADVDRRTRCAGRRPTVAARPDENGAGALRGAPCGDTTRSSVQQRFERLGLDMVGSHDRLDQRIRQEVVETRTVA